MMEDVSKQFSFRLPTTLIDRVEACADHLRSRGLDVTRTDVVRLLLRHALDTTHCDLELLLADPGTKKALRRNI